MLFSWIFCLICNIFFYEIRGFLRVCCFHGCSFLMYVVFFVNFVDFISV